RTPLRRRSFSTPAPHTAAPRGITRQWCAHWRSWPISRLDGKRRQRPDARGRRARKTSTSALGTSLRGARSGSQNCRVVTVVRGFLADEKDLADVRSRDDGKWTHRVTCCNGCSPPQLRRRSRRFVCRRICLRGPKVVSS